MPSFNDLPNEILSKIIFFIGGDIEVLRSLRLVSRQFHNSITMVIFANIYVDTSDVALFPERFQKMLKALATETTNVPCNVRNLRIFNGPNIGTGCVGSLAPGFNFLEAFIPKLVNLQSLYFRHSLTNEPPPVGYPPMAIERLMASFGALPYLTTLTLSLGGTERPPHFELPLDPLSNLSTLTIKWFYQVRPDPRVLAQISRLVARSPGLEDFTFVIPSPTHLQKRRFGSFVTLEELFDALPSSMEDMHLRSLETRGVVVTGEAFNKYLRHFRRLESLRICLDPSPCAAANIGGVLEVLSSGWIHLRNIHIDVLHHPSVFAYLSSYSGIEQLLLKPGHPLDNCPLLVEEFFLSVLPHHSESLKSLRIGGDLRTVWSRQQAAEHLKEVSRCKQLENIHCWFWISSEDVAIENSGVVDTWLEAGLLLPKLRQFKCPPVTLAAKRYIAGWFLVSSLDDTDEDPDPPVRDLLKRNVHMFVYKKRPHFVIDDNYN